MRDIYGEEGERQRGTLKSSGAKELKERRLDK